MLNIRVNCINKLLKGLCVFAFTTAHVTNANTQSNVLPIYKGVGGDFVLESTLGKTVALSDFDDKAVVLSFGYTNCSDVCPVT